jgi:tonB-dependent receptor|nr:TonB-dependent receptor [uncultured Capnocytophaga sp.]
MKNVFLCGTLAFSISSIAQNVSASKDSLPENPIRLDAIVIEAIRAKKNTPVAFSNVSKKEIQQKNAGQQLPMLLNHLPNVVSYSEDGIGYGDSYLYIRGNDTYRTNVTINGIPYNDSESQGAFFSNLSDFAASAESIQVQRGAGTSTNGAAAFGASLNVMTDAISENPYAEIANYFGSYNTHKHSVKLSTGKLNERFEVKGNFSKINTNGYIDRAFSDLKSYFLQGAYSDEHTLIKGLIFGGKTKSYLTYKGITAEQLEKDRRYNPAGKYTDNGQTRFYENETNNYQQDHAQLHWTEKWTSYWHSTLSFHYTKGRGYWERMKNKPRPGNHIRRDLLDNDFYGTAFSTNYHRNTINLILGGAANVYEGNHFDEYIWTQNPGYSYKELLDTPIYGNKKEGSAFVKLTWQVAPKLSLFGDIQYRYTHFKSFLSQVDFNEKQHLLNPKAGFNYYLNPNNTFYFSFAHVTKEPNRNDYVAYAEGKDSGAEFPKPEILNDFELGWRYNTEKVKLNANLYYMLYKDQLVLTGELNETGYPIRRNSGESYRAGIEVDAQILLSSQWQWRPNVSYSQNKNIDYKISDPNHPNQFLNLGNTEISFSPSWVAGNTLTFVPIEHFQINLISKYIGERYLTNENQNDSKLDSFLVHSLQLSYELLPKKVCKSILFTVAGNNLLNKKYVAHGRYDEKPLYFPAAEANGLVGVILSF